MRRVAEGNNSKDTLSRGSGGPIYAARNWIAGSGKPRFQCAA